VVLQVIFETVKDGPVELEHVWTSMTVPLREIHSKKASGKGILVESSLEQANKDFDVF